MSDIHRRQTAALTIVAAGIFWFATFAVGLANQASFFSMNEYLQSPMWTDHVPWFVNIPLSISALLTGFSSLLLIGVAFVGVVLLVSRTATIALSKVATIVLAILAANVVAYEVLATIGYLLARRRLPEQYGDSLQVFGVAAGIMCALAIGVWLSGRRRAGVAAPAVLA